MQNVIITFNDYDFIQNIWMLRFNKDLTCFSCFCAYEKKDVIVYATDIFFCCLI